jgi:NTE family protein
MSVLSRALEPNNLRLLFAGGGWVADVAHEMREDARFARKVATALSPWQDELEPSVTDDALPAPTPLSVPSLRGKRVGIVASGGSGALASLCGVRRALEEADAEVSAISACSGAVLFASLWAFGLSAEEMLRFWTSLRMSDYVDPDWRAVLRAWRRGFRDFAGLMRGEAIERTFRARFGDTRLGDARTPLFIPAWDIDRNRLVHIGSTTTPDLPLAVAVRTAISIPIFYEPVRIGGHLYGDGGIVSIFPARPLASLRPRLDMVLGVNCYFPRDFDGEDLTGWRTRSFAIARASAQLRTCVSLELAREEVRLLGDRLLLLHPVPYTEIAGARFYETFLDRSGWPRFARLGHECARSALADLQSRADEKARSGASSPFHSSAGNCRRHDGW